MFKKACMSLSVLALASCAYAIDGAHQDVTFETPGAENATCYAYIERLKYVVRPPQVINVFKSGEPMVVDCLAPGNRRLKIEIEPEIEKSTGFNAINGGVGLAWDYASKSLYKWPDVITVDFTGIPLTDFKLPDHNAPDIRQPEQYDLEEFSPGEPRLNSDKNALPVEILRRGETSDAFGQGGVQNDSAVFSEDPSYSGGKGSFSTLPGQ